ncbi:MAG: hypothetical protein OEZ06_25025 [Myxococcales bacterium]|nr:hypothetical protein [Myxococcales bacterium]
MACVEAGGRLYLAHLEDDRVFERYLAAIARIPEMLDEKLHAKKSVISSVFAVISVQRQKLPLSFAAFVKAALPYALVQLILATGYALLLKA